jgi:hypothetical protein
MDIPTEQLLNAGIVGVICATILFALHMVLKARANKDESAPPPLLWLAPALAAVALCVGGCGSIPEQYAKAQQGNRDTAGAEWWAWAQAKHAAGELTTEQLERRARLWYSWGYLNNAALGEEGEPPEPGTPTEKELAEATAADLAALDN